MPRVSKIYSPGMSKAQFKARLKELQKEFKTDGAIGAQFGISRQAIHQLREKCKIKALTSRNVPRNREITKRYNGGVHPFKLAQDYEMSVSQIYRVLNSSKGKK